MLNEERVKLMTKLASYESKEGKEDLKISAYYQKDYSSLHTIKTVIAITVGYVIALAIGGFSYMDFLIKNVKISLIIMLIGGAVIGYFILVVSYGIGAHQAYKKKHYTARQRVKKYNRNLLRLNKMYEKEKL